MEAHDWLIVGAGLTGATLAERLASVAGQRVHVIDQRPHVAGNAYDEVDRHGHLVHRYGPHIFHTNSERVWTYLSRFTRWRPYEHRVLGVVDGLQVPIPFNLASIDALFAPADARRLAAALLESYGAGARVPILKMRDSPEPAVRRLADFVYEKVFLGYTIKQWGRDPEQLDASVTGRVPIVVSRDDRYFQDRFQGMPLHGYTTMVRAMLDHPNIDVSLSTDFASLEESTHSNRVIYTGPIDAYFHYADGPLPYRSLRFEFSHYDAPSVQSVGTVNYTMTEAFTRVTEMKYLTGQQIPGTALITEYPGPYAPGENEPYYPIPSPDSRELHRAYSARAERLHRVRFAGRLGDYKYYNMDQAVARALSLFDEITS
jgi:UDP-galactopyranose mutase